MKKLVLSLLVLFGFHAVAASGIYWVPTNSPAEVRFAAFPLKDVEVRRDTEEVRVKYTLPLELTGEANLIDLVGRISQQGTVALSGAKGSGVCESFTDLSSCKIDYMNLKIDPVKRSDLLKQISKGLSELQLREAVAASFCNVGGEPCGFLSVIE